MKKIKYLEAKNKDGKVFHFRDIIPRKELLEAEGLVITKTVYEK